VENVLLFVVYVLLEHIPYDFAHMIDLGVYSLEASVVAYI
jgi:hypothetical protein